jgi:hypothetical protein
LDGQEEGEEGEKRERERKQQTSDFLLLKIK